MDWCSEAHRQDYSIWKTDQKADTFELWLEMRSTRNHELSIGRPDTGHLSL